MKSQIIVAPHLLVEGAQVAEVWWRGQLIAEVTGADGPGVRVISKHPMVTVPPDAKIPGITEVRFAGLAE
jgi:hypothetical protein